MTLKLFLISQDQNDDWDTYDSAVVAVPDEATAREIHPATGEAVVNWNHPFSSWCDGPEHVTVQYLGDAAPDIEQGVVCASFHAG